MKILSDCLWHGAVSNLYTSSIHNLRVQVDGTKPQATSQILSSSEPAVRKIDAKENEGPSTD